MARFVPNSVASGTTATQFDCVEQSPQPSQTASLIVTRMVSLPPMLVRLRLRRRRSSAAQVWS